MGLSGSHPGVIRGSPGVIRGSSGDCPDFIRGLVCVIQEVIWGSSRAHPWVTWGHLRQNIRRPLC
eukprot:12413196-Karenia_brevis.AAC.1